ncbi:hypothetical protein ABE25_16695 [Cytobacillus firmus]|nr:hypothetical protein [Cytobacillus firmus]MBG9603747.1 hypothetical protein [Cytobacillus firmus]
MYNLGTCHFGGFFFLGQLKVNIFPFQPMKKRYSFFQNLTPFFKFLMFIVGKFFIIELEKIVRNK